MQDDLQNFGALLSDHGYVTLGAARSKPVLEAMQEIALRLGGRILPGRGRAIVEKLKALEPTKAPLRSLSRLSGMGAQPWHVDGSHLIVPPRYLIFGCELVRGVGAPPTQLLRIKDVKSALQGSHSETFMIRNGGSSFYSTIASTERPWLRFDPGCMVARTAQGHAMLAALESMPIQPWLNKEWSEGDILIIDNWTVLHRRAEASGLGHRALLRISLKD